MSSLPGLAFDLVQASKIPAAYDLEIAGFPADEAASLESLQTRQSLAPTLFLGAYLPSTDSSTRTLVGFTCSTLTPSSTLTHASMSTHVVGAPYVAIHSICISAAHRRKGVAVALLKDYLGRLEKEGVRGARLITHEELVPLYAKAGFKMVGESEVVHGERKWWEMKVDFEEREKVVVEEVRNPGSTWKSFGGIEALLDAEGRNTADLFCPRGECRCILLKATVGKFVRRPASDLILPELPHPISSTTPSLSSAGYWSVPSPLAFENIGFSRNALPPSSSSAIATAPDATIKYLICADCDHGPLGWHDTEGRDLGLEVEEENEGRGEVRKGREFLLDVGRVRYRVKA